MTPSPTHWNAEDLWLDIVPKLSGFTVEVLPEIDSTNTELMRRARAGQAEPIVLVAESQTAGRGRQGKTWLNQPGDCLMYSLGMVLNPVDWSGLSLVVGLSIAESLQRAPGTHTPRIGVKWPNDLWLHDGRKLGGTLIETANLPAHTHAPCFGAGQGTPRFVIIGTGINVRPPHTPAQALHTPATCLQDVDARWTAPQALAQLLPRLVDDVLLFAQQGFAPFQDRFAARDVLRGQHVHLSDGSSGEPAGVLPDGTLQLRTDAGLRNVISGDVSVRPIHMALPPAAV